MCGQKIVDRKTTEEQMGMLGLKQTIDRLATASGVRWCGHVLRRDDDSILRVALDFEVSGKRKRGHLEEANGGGDREDWFEGKCPESHQVKRRSASNCRRNLVNPVVSAKGTTPDKN